MYVNGKMIPVDTIPRTEGVEIKENYGGDESQYYTLDIL
jgi:hypothetical protein